MAEKKVYRYLTITFRMVSRTSAEPAHFTLWANAQQTLRDALWRSMLPCNGAFWAQL